MNTVLPGTLYAMASGAGPSSKALLHCHDFSQALATALKETSTHFEVLLKSKITSIKLS